MSKIKHPDNFRPGNYYSVVYESGNFLQCVNGIFVEIVILDRTLFLAFETKKETKCLIPYRKIKEVGP